jgi:hypothetical protein
MKIKPLFKYIRRGRACAFLLLLALATPPAFARIQLVTLPERDAVTLTIYNSADITMVRDRRTLTLAKGINRLEFSWANTLIDPTSVSFQPLSHPDKVRVVDVRFPPRVNNLLEWRIESEVAGEVEVEIRYFTSGISWSADYVMELDEREAAMALSGYVLVDNQSGEDYENARIQLVVGVINLVDEIAELARRGRPGKPEPVPMARRALREAPTPEMSMAMDSAMFGSAMAAPKEIVKEGLSEYFIYTVEGRDSIPHGWSKRLPSFRAPEVPVISYYKQDTDRLGFGVMRYLQFSNTVAAGLGKEPLPDGRFNTFRISSSDDRWDFVGSAGLKYIPIGETVELDLDMDPEVLVEPRLMDYRKENILFDTNGNVAGWTTIEEWVIDFQNAKTIPVTLDVRRNFSGDWEIATKDDYQSLDANTIKVVRRLPAGASGSFRYALTERHGSASQR